ncbi:guanine nucleotide exchange factor [Sporodiniella umbellata]|nr:guanine nucleotide exchange factor [Sporodiniella umbellata]
MQLLIKFAGLQTDQVTDTPISREALKCIVNSIHLVPRLKKHIEPCIHFLSSSLCAEISQEMQFLLCRALFLLTVYRDDLVVYLISSGAANGIEKVLRENVSALILDKNPVLEPVSVINPSSTTCEALKLLFNVMLVDSRNRSCNNSSAEHFKGCLVPIFSILFEIPLADPQPMVPPHSQAVHALMQFPSETVASVWKSQKEWLSRMCNTPEKECVLISDTFTTILDKSIHNLIPSGDPDYDTSNDSQQTDAILSPLLLVIRNLVEKNSALRKKMSKQMLPSEK